MKIVYHTFGNNEDWGTLINGEEQIEIRKVLGGINSGLICSRDCTEKTNNRIKEILESNKL
jgi:hypothetical protein